MSHPETEDQLQGPDVEDDLGHPANGARPAVRNALRGSVYILPNLFTTASLLAGFWSLLLAVQGQIESAAVAILFGAVMDGLDGKVARLTNTASEFGIQYDSLADLVSFGVAPAFLAWMWHLSEFSRLGSGVCFLFVACAALRLARFNVSTAVVSKKFFIGLPSPAAGCIVALFVLFARFIPEWMAEAIPAITLGITLLAGLLMVSRVRYFSFKEYGFIKVHPFRSMVAVVIVVALLVSAPRLLGFLFMSLYVASGIIYSYILSRRDKKLLNSLADF